LAQTIQRFKGQDPKRNEINRISSNAYLRQNTRDLIANFRSKIKDSNSQISNIEERIHH